MFILTCDLCIANLAGAGWFGFGITGDQVYIVVTLDVGYDAKYPSFVISDLLVSGSKGICTAPMELKPKENVLKLL
jgi:hypothetical protein